MASKQIQLDDLTIIIRKRRTSRHLRLTVNSAGQISVSIPMWAPYKMGIEFAESRREWLKEQVKPRSLLTPNQAVGKAHHLEFIAVGGVAAPRSHVMATTVTVHYPNALDWQHPLVQQHAEKASIRALRKQAEELLPKRLAELAEKHGFTYNKVNIKQMKSRWGSCDSEQNIVLNLFLMQLPWVLIDYVLLHELTHTKIMRHGPDFWSEMGKVLPDVRSRRKSIKEFHPLVLAGPGMS